MTGGYKMNVKTLSDKDIAAEIALRLAGKSGEFDLSLDDLMLERRYRAAEELWRGKIKGLFDSYGKQQS
jgi:hypothetical protein